MAKPLEYTLGVQTDVGQTRSHNEDTVAEVEVPGAQKAFILCDGMGGLRAGDVASKEAVRVVAAVLRERFAAGVPADPSAELLLALTRANSAVNGLHFGTANDDDAPTERRMSSANPDNALMGTTCVAGVVLNDELYVAHAGDSRAYLWRGGRLTPLTNDHSYVAERVRAGDITEAEARVSRFRNMITQAIGIAPTVQPDVRREPLRPGDAVLVCSDGLTTELEDAQIVDLLRANPTDKVPADRVAQILIDAANRAGGHDNTSVILLVAGGVSAPLAEAAPVATANGARRNGTTLPRTQEAYEEEEETPARRSSSHRSSSRRSNREGQGLPLGPMAAGAALLAAIVGAMLASSPSVSRHVAHLLLRNAPDSTTTPVATSTPAPVTYPTHFESLSYEFPKRISETALRGDTLSYTLGSGLLCIKQDAGTMMLLAKDGKPIHASMGVIPSPASTVSASRLYVATDGAGDVYLSSAKNRSIEKRSVDGKSLKTIKGLDKPEAIAVDETGNIYVIDANTLKVIPVEPSIGGDVPIDTVAPRSKYGLTEGVTGGEPSPSAAPSSSGKPKKKVVTPSASPKDGA